MLSFLGVEKNARMLRRGPSYERPALTVSQVLSGWSFGSKFGPGSKIAGRVRNQSFMRENKGEDGEEWPLVGRASPYHPRPDLAKGVSLFTRGGDIEAPSNTSNIWLYKSS